MSDKIKNILDNNYKKDTFLNILSCLHGMSTDKIYAIINAFVSSMPDTHIYLEVGTYQGGSLIAALSHNEKKAIAVDDFSQFQETNNLDITLKNLILFGMEERVAFYNMSCTSFFKEKFPENTKIGVYYYDGNHGSEDEYNGLEDAWKYLDNDCIIIIDDYKYPPVHQSVERFYTEHMSQLQKLFAIEPANSDDPEWWNGLIVFKIKK